MKPFIFRPNVAISDIAFYAYGTTVAELLENSCKATTEAMVRSDKIDEKVAKKMAISGNSLEELLYNVLEEVIFLKDAQQLVFRSFKVQKIQAEHPPFSVHMLAKGEVINREKHGAHADVKAVTYQGFEVKRTKQRWRAAVTLDI